MPKNLKMRLLNVREGKFEEFLPSETPEYAILSHRWGKSRDEVSYLDILSGHSKVKPAYVKIQASFRQAIRDRIDFIWIDTCCIDKNSSTELSEAINSMHSWYKNAKVCYAYLSDVPGDCDLSINASAFTKSIWFRRGWTLQELLAPQKVVFFTQTWLPLGDKRSLSDLIFEASSIRPDFLDGRKPIGDASIAQRMSWASRRITSRPEDVAYSLLGIFSVTMDLRYGEGTKAFERLQEEIMKHSDDESLFAWTDPTAPKHLEHGLLADSPSQFAESYDVIPQKSDIFQPYSMTNKGLQIPIRMQPATVSYAIRYGYLNCTSLPSTSLPTLMTILLKRVNDSNLQYRRVAVGTLHEGKQSLLQNQLSPTTIYVPQVQPRLGERVGPPKGPILYFRAAKTPEVLGLKFELESKFFHNHSKIEWMLDSMPTELAKSFTPGGFRLALTKDGPVIQLKLTKSWKWERDVYKKVFYIAIGYLQDALCGFDVHPLYAVPQKLWWRRGQPEGTSLRPDGGLRYPFDIRVNVEKVRLRGGGMLHDFEVDCLAIDLEISLLELPPHPIYRLDKKVSSLFKSVGEKRTEFQ